MVVGHDEKHRPLLITCAGCLVKQLAANAINC